LTYILFVYNSLLEEKVRA